MRVLIVSLLLVVFGGCGFHLRGNYDLPFSTLFIDLPQNSDLRSALKRAVQGSTGTAVVTDAKTADAVFSVVSDTSTTLNQMLNASGQVVQLRLQRTFSFKVTDNKGSELLAPAAITLYRDQNYNAAQPLAAQAEQPLLWRDMQNDLVQQILRRLSAAKPHAAITPPPP